MKREAILRTDWKSERRLSIATTLRSSTWTMIELPRKSLWTELPRLQSSPSFVLAILLITLYPSSHQPYSARSNRPRTDSGFISPQFVIGSILTPYLMLQFQHPTVYL